MPTKKIRQIKQRISQQQLRQLQREILEQQQEQRKEEMRELALRKMGQDFLYGR